MAYEGGTWTTPESILPGAFINLVAKERATSVLSPRGVVAIPLELNWGAEEEIISFKAKDYTRDALYNFGYDVKSPELQAIDEAFCGATHVLVCRLNAGGEKAACDLGEAKWSGIRGNDLAVSVEADPDAGYVENPLADVKVTFSSEGNVVTAQYKGIPDEYAMTAQVLKDGKAVPNSKVIQEVFESSLSFTFTTDIEPGTYQIKAGLQHGTVKYTVSTAEVTAEVEPATSRRVELTKGTEKDGTAVESAAAAFEFKNNKITITFSGLPEGYTASVRVRGQVGILGFVPGRMEDMSLSGGTKHIITYSPGAPVNGEMTVEAVLSGKEGGPTVIKSCTYTAAVEGEDKPETAVANYTTATPEAFEPEVPGRYIVKTFLDGAEVNKQKVRGMYQIRDNDFVVWNKERELELTAGTPLSGGTNGEVTVARWSDILNKLETQNFHCLAWPTTNPQLQEMGVNFIRKIRDEMGIKAQMVTPPLSEPANYIGVIQYGNTINDLDVKDPDVALTYWIAGQEAGCAVQNTIANKEYDGMYDINVDFSQRDLERFVQEGYLMIHLARGKATADGVPQVKKVLLDINTLTDPGKGENDDWKNNQTIRVMDQCANDIAAIFNNDYFGKVPNNVRGREQFKNSVIEHHTALENIEAIQNFNPDDVVVEEGGNDKVTVLATDAIQPVNAMEKLFMTIVVI